MYESNHVIRIGLISDTHIVNKAECVPQQAINIFQGVDVILHAGDIFSSTVLDELEALAPVLAAEGDGDWLEDKRVKPRQILEYGGLSIGVVHDYGYWGKTEQAVEKVFGRSLDIVVYGHTHQAAISTNDNVLFIGPGSCTIPTRGFCGSIGILEILNGQSQANIMELD
ncbi:MAG: YfcE family phosphodiesterase [Chloroflexota bacterium]|nr:YfcE family phosphodiesterase [Chloroflexota bacterium]